MKDLNCASGIFKKYAPPGSVWPLPYNTTFLTVQIDPRMVSDYDKQLLSKYGFIPHMYHKNAGYFMYNRRITID